MYDLFTRPEQPEPLPATEMEVRDTEAPGQQQEFRRSEEQVKTQHGLLDKAVPTTANITSTSLLGKRHHSLYANLNGFEVERVRKVSVEHLLCLPEIFKMLDVKLFGPGDMRSVQSHHH